jgi:hypothetical protein
VHCVLYRNNIFTLILSSHNNNNRSNMDILNLVSSTIASTTNSVTYECVLTNNWSGANHPFDYARVSNSAHWSSPVLASHNSLYEMWAPEMLASPGVENIAETGSTGTLKSELNAAMNSGTVADFSVGINQFNNRDPHRNLMKSSYLTNTLYCRRFRWLHLHQTGLLD